MWNLTTNVEVVKDIPRIVKLKLVRAIDHDEATPPYLEIWTQPYGPGAGITNPYGEAIRQSICDSPAASTVLIVKPSPTGPSDQLDVVTRNLAGTPYTTLAGIFNGTTTPATADGRKKALEAACFANGVWDTPFAGTQN